MIEIIKKIGDYFNIIVKSFQDFYDTVILIFNMIPSPFKEILISGLIMFVILIALKIKEKFI